MVGSDGPENPCFHDMRVWVDGALDHIQPVEPFVRSIEPPVRAENDAIEPLTDGYDRLPRGAGRLGSAASRGTSTRGQAVGEDSACVLGQERHDHRTGIWCQVLTRQASPIASRPSSACSGRNRVKGLYDAYFPSTMKTLMRRPGYATDILWVGSEKILVMSS
jgi:hypothetical protein